MQLLYLFYCKQSNATMGANLGGGMYRLSPPKTGSISPNISMPHISERDDLFFSSSLHFGQKIEHLRGCVESSPAMLNIDLHP